MKHAKFCQQPKTLSLAVSAALTGIGLAMTLVAPARADLTIPTGTMTTTYTGGGVITISSGAALSVPGTIYAINGTAPITSLINQGTIQSASFTAIALNTSVNTINNSGLINGAGVNNSQAGGNGIANGSAGIIGTIINSGTITGVNNGIVNGGTITSLINTGVIGSTSNIDSVGLTNNGRIGTLINSGSIFSGLFGNYGIKNNGTIDTLINTGDTMPINNDNGTITTFTNQTSAVYLGHLPTNYNTYFASGSYSPSSTYATTVFDGTSGSITSYGIQLAASGVTLAAGTYLGVLQSSSAFTVLNAGQILHYTLNGYNITYELLADGNNYDLVIEGATGSGGSGGFSQSVLAQHNSPAYYAARIIDGNSNISNLFTSVSGSSAAAQSAAVSQSLPLITGGVTSVTQTALTSVNTIIDARQSANRGASSGDDFQTNRSMWMKAFGTEADQSDLDGVSGFKAHTGGVTFGADQKINDKLTLGAAFAYANSNVSSTVGGASQGMNIKGYQLIGYGSLALNNRDSVDFQLDGGMSNNSGSRNISFLNETASSSYNSWSAHLGSSLNRSYVLSDKLTLTPSLRADYTRINESGYQESGAGALDLDVNSQHAQALVLGVDGKLDYKLSDTLAVAANLGVGYDTMHKQDSIVAAYAGASSASFVTEGLNQGALISRAGAVLSYKLPKGMEVSAHYDVEGRRNYLSQTASVKFNMPF